jgi:regulator of protease activity HflC (stomatin/prohibitin superfamily)
MLQIDRLLDLITGLIWLITLVGTIVFVVRTMRRRGFKAAITRLISFRVLLPLILATTLSIISAAIVFIQPQETAVVISALWPRGYRDQPLSSGLNFIVPLAEHVVRYPISWQTYTMDAHPLEGQVQGDDGIMARTSDGQEVTLDISAIYRIDPANVTRLHIEWQDRYVDDLIRPVIRGVVRDVVSEFTAQEVNSTKRDDLQQGIYDRLKQLQDRLKAEGETPTIFLQAIIIRNIAFSPQYSRAVEQKQIAEQDRLLKEYEAEQIRKLAAGEADAIKIKASAQAYGLRLIAQAIKENKDLLTYTYIEKLSPGIKVMLLPNNAPFILPLDSLNLSEVFTSTQSITSETLLPPVSTVMESPSPSIPGRP